MFGKVIYNVTANFKAYVTIYFFTSFIYNAFYSNPKQLFDYE